MKEIVLLIFLGVGLNLSAQTFSFQDTTTTLDKTTDESPAHWYLEVINTNIVDTTLRWKASFESTLPPQWVITFDDQNNFYNPVSDGDSADFTLYAAPTFPQKMIIGAILNNTAGTASVYFDIYDPADPSFVQTIEYRFIISMGSGTMGTDESSEETNWFEQKGRFFTFPERFNSNEVEIYNVSGSVIYSEKITYDQLSIPANIQSGTYFITMKSDNTFYSTRILL